MGDVRLKNPVTEPLTPDFIPSLQQPRQQVLWVGCSDSSDFTETSLLNLLPDEMLVHRNIGNMVINGDLSCETTVKYAVAALQVKHITVCGHYSCHIVRATSRDGLKGPWLSKIDSLHSTYKQDIDRLSDVERDRLLVKLNILDQLHTLRQFPEVADAASNGSLQVHGIVYDPDNGQAYRLLEEQQN